MIKQLITLAWVPMFIIGAGIGEAAASGGTLQDTLSKPAVHSALAVQSMLSAVAHAGERLVAVGERGHVIYSDNKGRSWSQGDVPVSVTLTSVCFSDASSGWATGHRGVILHSNDGGESWALQYDGRELAADLHKQAQADNSELQFSTQMFVEDGPDKPLLTLDCQPDGQVAAAGAYGLGAYTKNAGVTWTPSLRLMAETDQSHVNASLLQDGTLYLAGEMGGLYRATPDFAQVARLEQPYPGSYFGLLEAQNGAILAFGLRGHLFRSQDHGLTWEQIDVGTEQSLTAGARLPDGRILLADASGHGWLGDADAGSFTAVRAEKSFPFTALLPLQDGSVVAVGLRGVSRFAAEQLK